MLLTKRVQVNQLCSVCNEAPETVLHILVLCPFARFSWEKSNISQPFGNFTSFAEWLHLVFQQQQGDKILTMAMVCWMLWKSRNELIWKQRSLDHNDVVVSACTVLKQWKTVQDRSFDHFLGYMSQEDGAEQWCLLPPNSLKVNSDAAIFKESNCYSFAFIVRDHKGTLVEARSTCSRGNPSPDLAELFGICEALSWIKIEDHSNVINESDCLQMVQTIRSSFLGLSYLGVINECRVLLASLKHKNITFRFVKRSANKVAHFLARQNCSEADRIWRVGDVHSDFHFVLSNDLKD